LLDGRLEVFSSIGLLRRQLLRDIFIVGLIAAGISLLEKPKPFPISEVAEAFLSYYLLFAIWNEQPD